MVHSKAKYGVVLVIIDGISDVAPSILGDRTPMQVANMPALDYLCVRGRAGLMDPVRAGLACGSDTAHLSLFGYNPEKVYRGRGAFETVGSGVSMQAGDVAFKCIFSRLDSTAVESPVVAARTAGNTGDFANYASVLASALDDILIPGYPEVTVSVKHTIAHRLVVCLRGPNLSDRISNTDPLSDGLSLLASTPRDKSQGASRTADIVNAVSRKFRSIIEEHPETRRRSAQGKKIAHLVLFRGAAEQIDLPSFRSIHNVNSFLIAPTKIIAGIGITIGLDLLHPPGATGDYGTNLNSKARECVAALDREGANGYQYDMGIIHIKAVDEAGHLRHVDKKVEWLEKSDIMIADLIDMLKASSRENMVLMVTGDHSTVVEYGDHSCEAVPFLLTDISPLISSSTSTIISADKTQQFDELNIGSYGSLGRFPGNQLMEVAKTIINAPQKSQK